MTFLDSLRGLRQRARGWLQKVVAGTDVRDMHVYGGLVLIFFGVRELSPGAAFALAGLLLFWLGVRK